MLRIGIDIGGTFTDFVVYDLKSGNITTLKILSDTNDPATTVLQGLKQIIKHQPFQIIHGSTVATNALLEQKGARTALVSTRGFKDVIQIARQNRSGLYDLLGKPEPQLVPSELRFEIDERVDHQGKVIKSLNPIQLEELIKYIETLNVESVAVCFLFSFLYPQHEQIAAAKLRESGFFVSASCEILPEYREYERTSTTVVNAYVSPILDRYLSQLKLFLPKTSMQIMQSNGGMIGLEEARHNGARCILSGPSGGIIGAQYIGQLVMNSQIDNQPSESLKLLTFDMGGTSTDVSLIDGKPGLTTEASVGGFPIHLPLLDIHTIGAGGGSIAHVDAGGSLRVGPQSAGSHPGPACYGTGDLPTVTDANLVLGRLFPEHFLGGKMQIDHDRAYSALKKLGSSINLSAIQAALGVIEVANIQMERALRVISIERGHDPRDFALFAFGGAGGLHAVELARRMGISRVIISRYASTLSAFGMLASNVIKDYVKTVMLSGTVSHEFIDDLFVPLISQGVGDIVNEGFGLDKIEVQQSLDMRYRGQSYELNIPFSRNFSSEFNDSHQFTYGYSYSDKTAEIVNLRLRAIGKVPPIILPEVAQSLEKELPVPMGITQVEFPEGPVTIPIFEYEKLMPGVKLDGPSLIVSVDTTILTNSFDVIRVDRYQNLLIDISPLNNIQ